MKIKLIEDIETIFPSSKIKEILYNGTDEDFKELDFSKINVHDDGYLGKGFYLSADKEEAYSYGHILKEFYVNIKNPFNFSDISYNHIIELSQIIYEEYKEKFSKSNTFLYWLTKKSNNDILQYLGMRLKENKASKDDILYGLEIILQNSNYILDGALMDFSDVLTPFIQSKGYDGAFISYENIKYFEVIVYTAKQVFLIS